MLADYADDTPELFGMLRVRVEREHLPEDIQGRRGNVDRRDFSTLKAISGKTKSGLTTWTERRVHGVGDCVAAG